MGEIRDAARTRAKILKAARDQFAARGFGGARMEAIAKGAGVTRQLLYHYFPSKDVLFEEVLAQKFTHNHTPPPESGGPGLPFRQRFRGAAADPVGVRFMTWEAAELGRTGKIAAEPERREAAARQMAMITEAQANGELPPEWPPEFLQLAISALGVYPLAYPQVTRMLTGKDPEDPDFQREWLIFLDALAERLSPKSRD
jgi:TetR/AcrR family transcriptional regulator